jgi:hypothetical protein
VNHPINISRGAAATAALAAGGVTLVFGSLSIADSQSSESTTVGIEHLILAGLTATLIALVPVVLYLGRLADRPRAAATAVTGQLALAALTVVSNVRGEDPAFFAAVAAPANLLIVAGLVLLAIGLRRHAAVPRPLAIALPISWILTLGLGGVFAPLAAGYWLAVGRLLQRSAPPRPRVAAQPAHV